MIFFFFQAEDGIRDGRVTGVQTCALPIWFGLLDGRTITTTHNSNYANFDVGWVNREIARLTRPKELTRRIDEDWAALDERVMRLAPWAPFLNQEDTDFFSTRVDLSCYVNNVLYGFDYSTICARR